jgi:Abnormal spindle-like microcephaly-assoc'd, ASPM-SPD-2-Hydin
VLTNARSWKIALSSLQTTGVGFSIDGPAFPLTLDAGQSVTLNVTFAPQAAGATTGSFFVSGAGRAISLSGIGAASGQLTANPAGLAFGSVQVGSTLTLLDSFTNTGGTSVTISLATVTGTGFSITGLNFPLVLNPGASVTFSAGFAPQSAVSATGGIIVSSNASNPTLNVSLSGTGTAQGQLTLTPAVLNFGNTTVGTSVSQTSNLSAAGASVTVSSANLSSAEFSLTGISFPATIATGQSMPITLTFSPQSSGTASAVLSVVGNASNASTQNMSGTGVSPTQHSVSLSWTDDGLGIAGYNIYRGSISGGPYAQINSGLQPTAAYSDNSVVSGQTYYYVTTAVDGSGVESGYSNEAEAVIPNP